MITTPSGSMTVTERLAIEREAPGQVGTTRFGVSASNEIVPAIGGASGGRELTTPGAPKWTEAHGEGAKV